MLRSFMCIGFFCIFMGTNVLAKEISGVTLSPTLLANDISLRLNGAGVRDKFFMDLYVASLYVGKTYETSTALLKADEPMALRLNIISSLITSEKMEEASKEGFFNATKGNTAPLQSHIDAFMGTFKEPIVLNDWYEFLYIPQEGVRISKNGLLKTTIQGLAFKEALFGIWLGEKPAQESLKKALLQP